MRGRHLATSVSLLLVLGVGLCGLFLPIGVSAGADQTISFKLAPALTKVANTHPSELTIDATGQTARFVSPSYKWDFNWKVPQRLTPGAKSSITLAAKTYDVNPEQPLDVSIDFRAPGLSKQLNVKYPSPGAATHTYALPISAGYKDAKKLTITIEFVSSSVTYTYRRAAAAAACAACATITKVHGDVSISHGGGTFIDASGGERVRRGDELATGPNSSATLLFPDGSTTTLEPNTNISIESLIAQKDSIRVRMNLMFGRIAAKVNKSKAAVSDYSVRTPKATASVRGTVFSVSYRGGTCTVKVTRGTVKVDPRNSNLKAVAVPAGYQVTVTQDRISRVTRIH